jgi:hypothetical protein
MMICWRRKGKSASRCLLSLCCVSESCLYIIPTIYIWYIPVVVYLLCVQCVDFFSVSPHTRRQNKKCVVVQGMLNRAGIRCSVEDKHSFKNLHPSDNTRADLTARGFGNMGQDGPVCVNPCSGQFFDGWTFRLSWCYSNNN